MRAHLNQNSDKAIVEHILHQSTSGQLDVVILRQSSLSQPAASWNCQSSSSKLEMIILRQSTSGQLELPVNQRLAGTGNLAPDNQRLAGTGRHGLRGLLPADTGHSVS